MNIHLLKCKLNLHDYIYKKEKHSDIIIYKKECMWCGKSIIESEELI